MKVTAVYPGSFDPVTRGHIDIIERAAKMYEELVVAVLVNKSKKSLFTIDERVELIKNSVKEIKNVKVDSFEGLFVDYCKNNDITVCIRGLRAMSDFETELQMAHINRCLSKNDVDTVFLATDTKYSYISSSVVKEIAMFDGDFSKLVTEDVEAKIKEKIKNN